jgi:hypothetical protein
MNKYIVAKRYDNTFIDLEEIEARSPREAEEKYRNVYKVQYAHTLGLAIPNEHIPWTAEDWKEFVHIQMTGKKTQQLINVRSWDSESLVVGYVNISSERWIISYADLLKDYAIYPTIQPCGKYVSKPSYEPWTADDWREFSVMTITPKWCDAPARIKSWNVSEIILEIKNSGRGQLTRIITYSELLNEYVIHLTGKPCGKELK